MSTESHYVSNLDSMDWQVAQEFEAHFRWEYDDGRDSLLNLYRKGKRQQWDSDQRIDWSQDLDPENPAGLPDEMISIFGSPAWHRLDAKERTRLRHHLQAWQLSQFLHGEQGALVCTAKIVQQVPNIDAKFYAATQVMDEARHVEAFSRLLHEKYELVYPINPYLKSLLDDTLRDSRWDVTYLGMQVLDRRRGARGVRPDPGLRRQPAVEVGHRLRHAGRVPARGLRPHGAPGLLPAAHGEGARRARGIRRRGLLPAARPVPRRRGLGAAGLPAGRVQGLGGPVGAHARVPDQPLHPHRADDPRHRPLGPARPQGLCGHGHPRFCRRRRRGDGACGTRKSRAISTRGSRRSRAPRQSPRREPSNRTDGHPRHTSGRWAHSKPSLRGVLHQWAAVYALGAGTALVALAPTAHAAVAAAIYAASLTLLLAVSAVYHRFQWTPRVRPVAAPRGSRVDLPADRRLIYPGGHARALGGDTGRHLLVVIWCGVALGVLVSMLWPGAPKWVSAALAIAVGWTIVPYFGAVGRALDTAQIWLIALGGIAYTLGALVYALKRPNPWPRDFGYHEIFHVLTLVGAGLHLAAVLLIVRSVRAVAGPRPGARPGAWRHQHGLPATTPAPGSPGTRRSCR